MYTVHTSLVQLRIDDKSSILILRTSKLED